MRTCIKDLHQTVRGGVSAKGKADPPARQSCGSSTPDVVSALLGLFQVSCNSRPARRQLHREICQVEHDGDSLRVALEGIL